MKKLFILTLLAVLALSTVSCDSEDEKSSPQVTSEPAASTITVTTSTSEQSSGEQSGSDNAEEPSGSTENEFSPLAEKYKDDPEKFDQAVYADHYGIDMDEAARRFDVMNNAHLLGNALEKDNPGTFSGFWIEHEPEFRLVAAFTRNGAAALEKYRDIYPDLVAITDVIEEKKYTEEELIRAQEQAIRILEDLGLFFSSATMVMDNCVEIYVTDSKLFYDTLEEAGVELPECVVPVIIYEPLEGVPEGLNPDPSVHFPQWKAHSGSVMEALLIGKLELVDGYLRVDRNLIIWQPDYFIHNNNGTIEVWDRDGNVVGRAGECIYMGGGQGGSLDWINRALKEPLPSDVTGPFWHQGSGTRLCTEDESAATAGQIDWYAVTQDLAPEEVLAVLPLFPHSGPSTYLESEAVTRITPLSCRTVYLNDSGPEYRTFSAEYAVEGTMDGVIDWYGYTVEGMGFVKGYVSGWSKNTLTGKAVNFSHPLFPSVSVEVHTYQIHGVQPLVYELLVVEKISQTAPYGVEILPADIESVTIELTGYNAKTITDSGIITELVTLVNSLPIRPDYVILGPPGSQTVFTLVFHSASEGEITVTSISGGQNTGINIEGHPVLDDKYNLLKDKIEQIMKAEGVQDC